MGLPFFPAVEAAGYGPNCLSFFLITTNTAAQKTLSSFFFYRPVLGTFR